MKRVCETGSAMVGVFLIASPMHKRSCSPLCMHYIAAAMSRAGKRDPLGIESQRKCASCGSHGPQCYLNGCRAWS